MPYTNTDKIQLLAEASKILSSSLDYHVTLASLAKLAVTYIADFCLIDIIEEGHMERVAVRVSDPKKKEIVKKMFNFAPDPRNKFAIYDAAKSGSPIIIQKATKSWLRTVSKIKEERDLVNRLGLHSFIFAPLKSRGKVIGVITLALSNPKSYYQEGDANLINELSSRAGIAIDNAKLFSEAQEALRSRDEFLSIASHELKTPLTSILLNLQLMLYKIRSATDKKVEVEELVKMIETSRKQSTRMAKLINDLLNISVISSGRLQIEKEPMDLSQLAKDIVERFEVQSKSAKIPITIGGSKSIVGSWDKVRIEQVVSNLISNALKYGKRKPVDITLSKTKRLAKLTIEDRGIGIAAGDRELIFGRFTRTEAAKDFRGLGVGLYISRQIVEAHGGKLSVESRENKGSKFILELPL